MNTEPLDLTGSKILIVDDQLPTVDILRKTLESKGYRISLAPNGEFALELAARTEPDLILLDVQMPGISGFETCQRLKGEASTKDLPVIFITAHDETEHVLEGFRAGGVDYISKPFRTEEVLIRVETHLKNAQLTRVLVQKNIELQGEIERREQVEDALQTADEQLSIISQQEAERWGIPGFVTQSQMMADILANIRRLHQADTTSVLITGESGTGKEMIARAIHYGGPRSKGPFFTLNCSAIPPQLAESTLFGHLRGAFTGADTDKKGYFELAHNGTLFLDEIGNMPLELQVKLLRVLEYGVFTPVGSTEEKGTDVRVLSATNADLRAKIAAGEVREDLYYRLAGFEVNVPSLRERKEDIPLLAAHFLSRFATEMRVEKPTLREEALAALTAYPFPGNIRELRNIIERALIESGGVTIQPEHLHLTASPAMSARVADESSLIQQIIAGGSNGLHVIDVSQPKQPLWLHRLDASGAAYGLDIVQEQGGRVTYIADGRGGLKILKIDNPFDGTLTHHIPIDAIANDVGVENGYAYIAAGEDGLIVMDVRDANRPKMISQIPTSEPASSVEIDSGYAYLCAGELIVLDIRNANRIRVLARRQMPGSAYRVALAEGRAYVAALDGGVQVFDVAAPANPRAIGSYETKGNVTHITMAGTRAYVLDSLVGVQIVDMTDAGRPVRVAEYETGALPTDSQIRGDHLYLLDAESVQIDGT